MASTEQQRQSRIDFNWQLVDFVYLMAERTDATRDTAQRVHDEAHSILREVRQKLPWPDLSIAFIEELEWLRSRLAQALANQKRQDFGDVLLAIRTDHQDNLVRLLYRFTGHLWVYDGADEESTRVRPPSRKGKYSEKTLAIMECFQKGMKDRQLIATEAGCSPDDVSKVKSLYPDACKSKRKR